MKIRSLSRSYREENGAQIMAEVEAISNEILEEL